MCDEPHGKFGPVLRAQRARLGRIVGQNRRKAETDGWMHAHWLGSASWFIQIERSVQA